VKALAAIAAFPAAAAAIWLLLRTPLVTRLAAAPREDRWHERTTPMFGGIGIFAGLLAGVGVAVAVGAAPANRELLAIVGGCAILFVAGLLDDLFSLGPIPKLAALYFRLAAQTAEVTAETERRIAADSQFEERVRAAADADLAEEVQKEVARLCALRRPEWEEYHRDLAWNEIVKQIEGERSAAIISRLQEEEE